MWNGDFIQLDTAKGNWLLDIAAHRQWQIDEHNDGTDEQVSKPLDKHRHQQLREAALELYTHLHQSAQDSSDNMRIRLFRYLAGETMEKIGESEIPPVTRQAIQKSLKRITKGMSAKRARQIWFYGQYYQ